jgi:hypothetical protein
LEETRGCLSTVDVPGGKENSRSEQNAARVKPVVQRATTATVARFELEHPPSYTCNPL